MYQFYIPVLLLQIFCLYHAYQNRTEQRWYWLIIFFPLGGGLIYLYTHFYNRSTIENLTENVKGIVISNYRIEQLEKEMRITDSIKAKTALADEYVRAGRYKDAIDLYTDCAQGFMADDVSLLLKLVQTHSLHADYTSAVVYGQKLEQEKSFRNAPERASYAWALHYTGNTGKAEKIFMEMDNTYSNYLQRLEYCRFLIATQRSEEATRKLGELLYEFEQMKSPERRLHRTVASQISDLYETTRRKTTK